MGAMDYTFLAIISLSLFGLVMGSFAGAQVWRLRLRQLQDDKSEGYDIDKAELKRLTKLTPEKGVQDRSRCLSCGHQLAWYDLMPLVSWLSTAGKCRYCRTKIGWFEPLMETGVATAFIISYLAWPVELISPLDIAVFFVYVAALVPLSILFAYDAKWFLLPDKVNRIFIALASLYALLSLSQSTDLSGLASLAWAMVALPGFYGLLYYYSRARNGQDKTWVGFGDVKLVVGLALLLLDWRLALVALFVANLLGTLVIIPAVIRGKLGRRAHVPFGPFLILGTLIALLFGQVIIDWYVSLLLQ